MQNVYFNEIEAAYMRRRVQDAVAAIGRAAQANPPGTRNRRLFLPSLTQACLRAREVFQQRQPIPGGRKLPAAQS